jgi:hypothetical protein
VTRSGGEDFHGTLFELYRTPSLNANEYENNLNGRPKGQYVQHIFGGSIGGPVYFPRPGEGGPALYDGRKHKTFFFTNLQMLRTQQGILTTRTVYTPQARQGLFRYRVGAANAPAGTGNPSIDGNGNVLPGVNVQTYNVVANDPLCRTQPTNCGLDPTTQSLINEAPLPNNYFVGDGLNTAGFSFAGLQLERQWDFVIKVDHAFNDRNSIYVRYAQGAQNTFGDNANGGLKSFPDSEYNFVDTFRNPKNLAVNYRWTPTGYATNEFVVGLNKFAFSFTNPDPNANSNPPFILNLPRDPFNSTPPINNLREITTYQVVDNLSWISGAHTFRGGINFRFQQHDDIRSSVGGFNTNRSVNFSRTTNPPPTTGAFNFNLPSTTGPNAINNTDRNNLQSAINDLLGRVGNISQSFVALDESAFAPPGTLFLFDSRYNEYDFYFQDTWKIWPNFTLDWGVRWEPKMAPGSGPEDTILRPDRPVRLGELPTDQLRFVEGKLFDDDWNNLSPTVGFAWDPFSDGKTSIRANYRLVYDRMNTFLASSAIFPNAPGNTLGINDTTFANRPNETSRVRFGLPVITPPSTPGQLRQPIPFSTASLTVFDPSTRFPKTNQWALSIQRDIGKGFVVEANYIGRRGVGLFGAYDVNQANIFTQDARCPGESFLQAFNTLRGSTTATSCLANTLFTGSPTNNAGSTSFRNTFSSELNQGSVASAALLMSQRVSGGVRTLTANGFPSWFFQPYPQFTGAVNVIDSSDFSTYNGMELQVSRRASNGLLMQLSYTWAKSLDTRSFDPAFTVAARTTSGTNASPSAQNTPFDIRNRKLNYGRSDFDRRHSLQGYLVYDLPFGRNKRFLTDASGVVNQIVGGWEVANALIWQSGRAFTVYSGAFTVSNVVLSTANCNGCTATMGQVVQDSGTNFIFTPEQRAMFTTPAPGQLGNTPRNFFTGPQFFNLDMTLRKRFYFTETTNLEFRADINNLTNTPSFEFPISSTSGIGLQSPGFTGTPTINSTFGRIRDSVNSNARRIQLGIKFNF